MSATLTPSRVRCRAESRVGPIDILVNSAGDRRRHAPSRDYPLDEWRRVIDVNLHGAFLIAAARSCRHAAAQLRPHRQHRLDRGQGGQPQRLRLLRLEGRRDRAHQVARQGARDDGVLRELRHAGRGRRPRSSTRSTRQHIDFMLSKIPMGRFGRSTRSRRWSAGSRRRSARSRPARSSTSPAAGRRTERCRANSCWS